MRWRYELEERLMNHRDLRRWRPRLWVLPLLSLLFVLLILLLMMPLVLVQLWMTRRVGGLSVATLAPTSSLLLFLYTVEKSGVS